LIRTVHSKITLRGGDVGYELEHTAPLRSVKPLAIRVLNFIR
jgi:hypothetical protein